MADGLNMNGLSLQDSQHSGQNGGNGYVRSAYIPPHARREDAPRPGGGMDGSAWAGPSP